MPDREKAPEEELAIRTRRSFLTMAVAAAASCVGWTWLRSRMQEDDIPYPFRRAFAWNELVSGKLLFSHSHLAPTYPPERQETIRANGSIGLDSEIDVQSWRLALTPCGATRPERYISMEELRGLPETRYTAEFKCVEGWSTIASWGGVRLSDFVQRYAPDASNAKYVAMATPDENYYIGIDMASALHPQTLLSYELNGKSLTAEHGAPLRLVAPVKYGIKNLKRIGSIRFTNERPDDYWAERGYDYYAAL